MEDILQICGIDCDQPQTHETGKIKRSEGDVRLELDTVFNIFRFVLGFILFRSTSYVLLCVGKNSGGDA